jgi:hypothetical protein
MAKDLKLKPKPSNPESLAKHFLRLGWLGFWMQLALLLIPIVLLLYVIFIGSPESVQRKGIDLSNYLSFGSLVIMLFTTFWFYRYTRLAKKMVQPDTCPSQSSVMRTLWIGLGASSLGIFFSTILMLRAVFRLLFIVLATPQTGVPFAAPGGDPSNILTAFDVISLTSLLLILTAELIVLAFSLWILFRATRPSSADEDATASD